jgi:hypothetical protein
MPKEKSQSVKKTLHQRNWFIGEYAKFSKAELG